LEEFISTFFNNNETQLSQSLLNRDYSPIENIDVSNVTSMRELFANNTLLSTANFSNWDVSNFRDFSEMFKNCFYFKGYGLEKWNINPRARMNEFLYGCWDLDPSLNLNNVPIKSLNSISMPIIIQKLKWHYTQRPKAVSWGHVYVVEPQKSYINQLGFYIFEYYFKMMYPKDPVQTDIVIDDNSTTDDLTYNTFKNKLHEIHMLLSIEEKTKRKVFGTLELLSIPNIIIPFVDTIPSNNIINFWLIMNTIQ